MPCPAGTYNGSHGLTSAAGCAACPAGTRCPGGSAEALKCAPGTVAPNNSSAACVKCVAGKYQAETGQLTCDDCGKGAYCEAGANAETRCKAGYYSDKVRADNASACKPCAAGYACPTGSIEPTRCQPGSVQSLTGQATCAKCAAGTFQSSRGRTACEACTLGGYCMQGASLLPPTLTRTLTLTLTLTVTLTLYHRRLLAEPMRGRQVWQPERSRDLARLLLLRAW